MKPGLLTTAEAAARLGISAATLKRWAQSGLIPSERTEGGHRRFRAEDVHALANPGAGTEDPARRGADLVVESTDVPSLQGWLLQARRELGSWWTVAQPLRAVVAEVYRRRASGALTAVQVEVAFDRLRGALLRLLDGVQESPGAPRLLVGAVPGDHLLVAGSFLVLAAGECGWNAEWVGHPTVPELEAELERRPARAVVICGSVTGPPETMRRHEAGLRALAASRPVAAAVLGMGEWPEPTGSVPRFAGVAEVQSWLMDLSARLAADTPSPPAAPTGTAPGDLRWDRALSLGHPVIDAQHQALFKHAARFQEAVRRGDGAAALAPLLRFVADYAQAHFHFEEDLMERSGYPARAAHVLEHQRLAGHVAALTRALGRSSAPATVEALAGLLSTWLRDHVSGSDQRIGEHLRASTARPG